jgi:MscS family membrane protein
VPSRRRAISRLGFCVVALLVPLTAQAQKSEATSPPQTADSSKQVKDTLGRDTPRGTVRGFLAAARTGQNALASQYLQSSASGTAAAELAHQLFIVLDARLPPRLSQLSDLPEGSRVDPLVPNRELVGTVAGAEGPVEIVLARVTRPAGDLWLFSDGTLAALPTLYEEITLGWSERGLPRYLTGIRLGGVRLWEWICVLLGLPILYLTTVVLNKILSPLIGRLSQRVFKKSGLFARDALPVPVRLLLLALAIQWFRSILPAPLLVRQFWSNTASVITIAAVVWLLILVNGVIERHLRRRFPATRLAGAASVLRLGRRIVDGLLLLAGLVGVIRLYGIDPTPALAGLGVGGIAVALAAQKTLENVIAGTSLILDQAVRVGDVLKMGNVLGTVEHIGLRSTRLRTLDRTVVSMPNSQIANASLEILSARDKYWFHPIVGLRRETTPQQLRAVVEGIRRMLETHPAIDAESIRVRFVNVGQHSLDVDVSAYLYAQDGNHFLELQERLLLGVTETVEAAGTAFAVPLPTMPQAQPVR